MSQPAVLNLQDQLDNWENKQRILVILAHPDDPEFFCGGTIARWNAAGHEVAYCLLTCGDKGTKDIDMTSDAICRLRQAEQIAAAAVLGVQQVRFLDHPDGYLVPDLDLRRDITRVIRQSQPDVLVTCDPTNLYVRETLLNHPDHRAAGQATLDAVYPAARDHLNFIELWRDEHLDPHLVREVWIASPKEPTVTLDVTEYWEIKIRALFEHKSQIGDPPVFEARMRDRHTPDSTLENPRYVENFRRLLLG
jgi:LmbE family N-acetylglucosaminyl deacetylase